MTGTVDVIAAHSEVARWAAGPDDDTDTVAIRCQCGRMSEGPRGDGHPHFRHVADELAAAGTGVLQEAKRTALLEAADAMDAREGVGDSTAWTTDLGYYGEAAWLRARAHSLDPEGHALVQAIHDRKNEPPAITGHDTSDLFTDHFTNTLYVRCGTCHVRVLEIGDAALFEPPSARQRYHFRELIENALAKHREELEASNGRV